MGIKITELTSACKLVGNELTPLIQSTETRQTAVSSVFTALTAQSDGRYVCGVSSPSQGSLNFLGAGVGGVSVGLGPTNSVVFAGVVANGDIVVANPHKLCSRGVFCASSNVTIDGALQTNGNMIFGNAIADTVCFNACDITVANGLPAGVDNSVVILDSDNTIRVDEINPKVWGNKLVDTYNSTVTVAKIPRFYTSGGTVEDSVISDNGSTVTVAGNLTVTGTSQYDNNANISCSLTVTGNLTVGGNLTLTNLPTSDPGVSGRVWRSGTALKISCST